MAKLDFEGLNRHLTVRIREIVTDWAPGGKVIGNEYKAGSITGGDGDSFSINLNTAKWSDFATSQKGGDLVSLYGEINGKKPGEAFRELSEKYGFMTTAREYGDPTTMNNHAPPPKPEPVELSAPPPGTIEPNYAHKLLGEPSNVWTYRALDGSVLFHIARYDIGPGEKEFRPFSWAPKLNKWVNKSWENNRPLYGLEFLKPSANGTVDKPVLIVEGEKACDAARTIVGDKYIVISWAGGAQAWDKVDWTPIYKSKGALLWPDADLKRYKKNHLKSGELMPINEQPGFKAMNKLGVKLAEFLPEVKILNVGIDHAQDGWDAFDALSEGWDWNRMREWAKPIAAILRTPLPAPKPVEKPKKPEPKSMLNVSLDELYRQIGVERDGNDNLPRINEDNVLRLLEGHPEFKDFCWYDSFHDRIMTKWRTDEPKSWDASDSLQLLVLLQRRFYFKKLKLPVVENVVNQYAAQRGKNEPQDWIKTLTWDRVSRLDSFFIDNCGAKDTDYVRAVTKNWWIAMVARIMQPGVKFDNILIIEGKTRIRKSSMFDAIGGKFYTEPMENVGKKDFLLSARGKFLIEIAELDAFNGAQNSTKKRVLSTRIDRIRSHYGRNHEDAARWFVFVGTTNKDTYLDDETGDARYWPIWAERIDLETIKANREQYFAEAYTRFLNGESWWEVPESARLEQSARHGTDAWQDVIENWLMERRSLSPWISTNEIATFCLQLSNKDLNWKIQERIRRILIALGYVQKQNAQTDNKKRWIKAEKYEPFGKGDASSRSDEADGNSTLNDKNEQNSTNLGTQKRVVKNYAPGASDSLY